MERLPPPVIAPVRRDGPLIRWRGGSGDAYVEWTTRFGDHVRDREAKAWAAIRAFLLIAHETH